MKENVLATVAALVEKAADERTNVDEARNAGLQACRLIKKYGLLARPPARPRGFTPAPYTAAETVSFEDIFDLFRDVAQRQPSRRPQPAAPPPQPTAAPSTKRVDPADPNKKTVPIVDHPAHCALCTQRILRGKFAVWSKGMFYHQTCWDTEAGK